MTTSSERMGSLQITIQNPLIINAFFAYISQNWYTIPSVKEYNSVPKIFAPYMRKANQAGQANDSAK